jgi:hypothetical protein
MDWKLLGMLACLGCSGCSLAKTTFLSVDPNGNFVETPNRCVHGVPAVVKVPTHLEVAITQTDYWKIEQVSEQQKRLVHLPEATSRKVEAREITTNKLIMIDPKRPLSGEGQFSIEYSDNGEGVLQAVNYKAVDETLRNSAALAAAALRAFGTSASQVQETGIGGKDSKLVKVQRVIAVQRFPIEACRQPDIESTLAEFVHSNSPDQLQPSIPYFTETH